MRPRPFAGHAGPIAVGPALIAGIGCALPLLLGLLSGHPGFLWAAAGAFVAAQANPLHRFGMLRLLLLSGLGACSAALGFAVANDPLLSLLLFAACGVWLAWLLRFGAEAGKFGLCLAACLCLGQGQPGLGNLSNAYAVAALFVLGGLLVALLAFGLRGAHGLRTWPHMPHLIRLLKVLRRHARRLPRLQWQLRALAYGLVFGLAGLLVSLADLPRGYWLTLTALATLQLTFQARLQRALQHAGASLGLAGLLILLGYQLQSPGLLVAALLPLIVLSRALQASGYGLYLVHTSLCFVLLAESLSLDWALVQGRLFNALLGVTLALLGTGLVRALQRRLTRPRAALPAD